MDALRLAEYLDALVPERSNELKTMEQYAKSAKVPIIGPAVGNLLYLLAKLTHAQIVLEMEPGFGYSTGWLARAMKENGNGLVHHCDTNEDFSMRAQQHLMVMGLSSFVKFHMGSPLDTLREIDGRVDMIFMNVGAKDFSYSLPLVRDRLRPGGIVAVNGLLAEGKVLDHRNNSPEIQATREVTRLLTKDPGWTCSLIPLGNGLMIAQKKSG